jgi:Zn-dependent protease
MTSGDITIVLSLIAVMSLFLAGFNLLPIPPLDGYKVAIWSIPVYVAMVAVTGFGLLLAWGMITIG